MATSHLIIIDTRAIEGRCPGRYERETEDETNDQSVHDSELGNNKDVGIFFNERFGKRGKKSTGARRVELNGRWKSSEWNTKVNFGNCLYCKNLECISHSESHDLY